MDVFSYLMHGFQVAMLPENLLIALIGAFIGTIVGMLPGWGQLMVWPSCCLLRLRWVCRLKVR